MNRNRIPLLACALAVGAACEPEGEMFPAGPLVFPDEPFRAMAPVPTAPRAFEAPRPQVFTLPAGVEVILIERRSLPLLRWFISFPTGSLADPPGKEGLASLCMNVMFQGSRTLDRSAREQSLADVAAAIDISTGAYEARVSANSLRPDLDATLQMWSDLFLQPALDPGSFAGTVRARMAALIASQSLNPTAVAARVNTRLFWGTGHPYLREPTMESFAATTLADCQAFFAGFRGAGTQLFVAGDISRAEVEEKFGPRLMALAGSGGLPAAALELPAPSSATGSVFFVDSPGAPQSIVTLRAPGPARASSEYYAAQIMASILAGSSITSRIGMNVREMKGYAYSLNGVFIYDKKVSYFDFAAPVVRESTAESVFEVLEEIRKMREEEVTDEELSRERDGLQAGLPYQFETVGGALGSYQILTYYGLPFSYYQSYIGNYASVTKAAVRQAAEQHLRPGLLQILVVGDGATVLPKLRELASLRPDLMGRDVVVLDPRGNRL